MCQEALGGKEQRTSPVTCHWCGLRFWCLHLQICSLGQRAHISAPPAELMSHSGAGPLDAGTGGSPWGGMQQEAAARGDEDETKPAGDHRSGSLPNRRNGFAALDLLNTQLAQKGSHLLYAMRRLRSSMREKSFELRSDKFRLFLHPSPLPAGGTCRESWERDGEMKN